VCVCVWMPTGACQPEGSGCWGCPHQDPPLRLLSSHACCLVIAVTPKTWTLGQTGHRGDWYYMYRYSGLQTVTCRRHGQPRCVTEQTSHGTRLVGGPVPAQTVCYWRPPVPKSTAQAVNPTCRGRDWVEGIYLIMPLCFKTRTPSFMAVHLLQTA
jgi:hypothetical protein